MDTHIIQVDFFHGREIYKGIAEGLKDKDIGVLGKVQTHIEIGHYIIMKLYC